MCESAINRLQKRPPKWQTQCSKLIWSNYLVCNKSESTSLELPPLAPWFLGAGHSQWLVLCPRRVGRGPGCRLHPVHRPLAPHTLRRPDRWQPPRAGVSRASPRIGWPDCVSAVSEFALLPEPPWPLATWAAARLCLPQTAFGPTCGNFYLPPAKRLSDIQDSHKFQLISRDAGTVS